tara:strand:+ start:2248 stop:2448 length:201 start_codon:yes stop_codon:yes gene_type:complete
MNKKLIKQISSINKCFQLVESHYKDGSHIDEDTLKRLTSDLAEVTATFNQMYESLMDILCESIEKN